MVVQFQLSDWEANAAAAFCFLAVTAAPKPDLEDERNLKATLV